MSKIRFMKHFVTNGVVKARVHYSFGEVRLKGTNSFVKAVSLYAKDYEDGRQLKQIFTEKYQNATDIMSDYFEKGRVRFFEQDELYEAALKLCK